MNRSDAVVVGGGHNGLVAATLLARQGWSVTVFERAGDCGGAAVSSRPFAGVDARLSRYAYLVSLFPAWLRAELGIGVELRRRRVSSYTPDGDGGVLIADGAAAPGGGWERWHERVARMAARLGPTLTEPLRAPGEIEALLADEQTWSDICEQPLSAALERELDSDLLRGIVLTDALIGTFAAAGDPQMRQNRCLLYHVIGDGTGHWDVPVGGMGALTAGLVAAARAAGVRILNGTEVASIAADGAAAEVTLADGSRHGSGHVLANVAPAVLASLLGAGVEAITAADPPPEGSQLKVNMLLRRLPRLRDPDVEPELAFAGTFHVNESYSQLQRAYLQAAGGQIPALPPCELYCHSLTDPTILGPELRAAGAQTLTLFGLHMPARVFAADPTAAKQAAVDATLASVDSVLAEPLADCLWHDADGRPCLEALTPLELEAELGLPGGHIFHRDLSWPWAESAAEVGSWGAETALGNVWLCGAGARRGGGVSGIPGHNAARAVLASARR